MKRLLFSTKDLVNTYQKKLYLNFVNFSKYFYSLNTMLSVPQIAPGSFTLCCYINRTDKIQIGRIANIDQWYFERVIFPQQRLLFDAPPEAELEIYANDRAETTRIRCKDLLVK